MAHGIVSSWM